MGFKRVCSRFLLSLILKCVFINTIAEGLNENVEAARSKSALHPAVLNHLLHVEVNNHLRILGNISDETLFLKRTFLDDGHKRAAALLSDWMSQAGLTARIDAIGNVRGRVAGLIEGPAMLIGSHYDTVIDGGIYDGAMGILVGIAAAKAAILSAAVDRNILDNETLLDILKDSDADLDCDKIVKRDNSSILLLQRSVEIIGFSDEEGVRFQSTFLGSRALAGNFTEETLSTIVDKDGVRLRDLLLSEKIAENVEDILHAAARKDDYAGYLEVHIEQGPLLEMEGQPLGVVSGIAGQSRGHVTISGEQGHAGTVPMRLRKDPLPAAAFLVHYLEELCYNISIEKNASSYPSLDHDDSIVCSVGSLNVWPGASNVIPGKVNFTVDIRSLSDISRIGVQNVFKEKMIKECFRRDLICNFELLQETKAVTMNQDLTDKLEVAITKSQEHRQVCQANNKVLKIPSGAGHDAIPISEMFPTSMLFVRCKLGISHHPEEFVDPDDVSAASWATFYFLQEWLL